MNTITEKEIVNCVKYARENSLKPQMINGKPYYLIGLPEALPKKYLDNLRVLLKEDDIRQEASRYLSDCISDRDYMFLIDLYVAGALRFGADMEDRHDGD